MFIPPINPVTEHEDFREFFSESALHRIKHGRAVGQYSCLMAYDDEKLVEYYREWAYSPSTAPTVMMPYFDRTVPNHLADYWNENERFKMLIMALVIALTPLWGMSTLAIGVEWLKHREIKKLKAMMVTEMYHSKEFFEFVQERKIISIFSNGFYFREAKAQEDRCMDTAE